MAQPCGRCDLQPAETLPCGHAACAACLREHDDGGRRCPSCCKIFKADPAEAGPRPQAEESGAPMTPPLPPLRPSAAAVLRRVALALRSLAAEATAEALRLEAKAGAGRPGRSGDDDDAEVAATLATDLVRSAVLRFTLDAMNEVSRVPPGNGKPAVAANQTKEEATGSRPAAKAPGNVFAGAATAAEPGPGLEQQPAGGASPSQPLKAPATFGPLPADAAVATADPGRPSGMESLPDEVLELILSMVPTTDDYSAAGLMRLRRVSRQWARVLCSAEVWRRHTLDAEPPNHRALRDPCIPALHAVSAEFCRGGSKDAEAVLRALTTTHCKIRCLELDSNVTAVVSRWVPRILQQHCNRLQELSLGLQPKNYKSDQVHYADSILAVVATMPRLQTLSLRLRQNFSDRIEYDMSQLRTLKRLRLDGGGLGTLTKESLLRANKDTLLEVDCDDHDVFALLPQCPLLRKVTTSAMHCPTSGQLADVRGLRTLLVKATDTWLKRGGLRSLLSLLDGSPDVPAELYLDVDDFEPQFTLLHAAASLGSRLRSLRLTEYRLYLTEAQLVAALRLLPHLERLMFGQTEQTDWALVVDAWTERTAPALRELHVHWRGAWDLARSPTWAPRLQALRPELRICTNNDCPACYSSAFLST